MIKINNRSYWSFKINCSRSFSNWNSAQTAEVDIVCETFLKTNEMNLMSGIAFQLHKFITIIESSEAYIAVKVIVLSIDILIPKSISSEV